MKNFKVSIVGGSIGGLSAALVLASAISDKLNFEITVIDEGGRKADLFKALPYNVALFSPGIEPEKILEDTRAQIATMGKVEYVEARIDNISGKKGDFTLSGGTKEIKADYIILATGANEFEIKGLGDVVVPHTLMNKPNKIKLKVDESQKVLDGVYAAGLVSGVTSMIACAMGSGAGAACGILSDIHGTVTVLHDSKGTRA